MIHRRSLCLLLLVGVPVVLCGCALHPDHLTVSYRHVESDTTGGPRRTHTSSNEAGVSASYDFPRR